MADALCGPSNALQDVKRYTQVDRSLQQDRLTGPRTPQSAFRTRDPRTGSLDAEFHAFENAAANPFQEPFVGNGMVAQPHFQQLAPSNWAADFQQLTISDQPLPAQQFRNYAPLMKSTNGGWQHEYARPQQGEQSSVAQGKQIAYEQQIAPSYAPHMHYQPGFTPMASYGAMEMQQVPESAQAQTTDEFAGADWSQAFEEAFQDAFQDAEQVQKSDMAQDTEALQQEKPQIIDMTPDVLQTEQVRIGSDAIDYTEMKDRTADQEQQDANALARVAGELLHNVQHDSSEKFQNSQFLDLMRKIRDRQVEVRNNDFETTTATVDNVAAFQTTKDLSTLTDEAIRHAADPSQNQDTFAFPNMNTVYAPREGDFVDYTFDSDQFPAQPRTQISDLHPGGKYYPEQSPPIPALQMSGAVLENALGSGPGSNNDVAAHGISAADFESKHDENRELASRYQRTTA